MAITGRTRLQTTDHLSLLAEWSIPEGPSAAAVLCHPHPRQGGDMGVTVIDALFKHLPKHGIAALRFNFRGVGTSEGDPGDGDQEHLDVAAAVGEAATLGVDVWVMGWSFGAEMALTCVADPVVGWFGVAPPLRILDAWPAAYDPRPKVLAIPENDQFNPPMRAQVSTAPWMATTLQTIAGADHFLAGQESLISQMAVQAVEQRATADGVEPPSA